MRRLTVGFVAAAAVVSGAFLRGASAEIVELTNGAILQGDVESGRTTDEGLALNLYDTGGVVLVKWDHIVESRRKQLRLENGIDVPEETEERVPGHRVRLTNGEEIVGVAENPRGNDPLRMKTRTGVRTFERAILAGPVQDVEINGLLVYTEEELYQKLRDENPPETAAAHKLLAQKAMNIGAYEHAKEHLLLAKADIPFMETAEGKGVEPMLRNTELMIRAKGANELVKQIRYATSTNTPKGWNDAKKLLEQLDTEFKDKEIRNTIAFDLLSHRTLKNRELFFQKAIGNAVFRTMEDLISDKARETKPLTEDPNQPRGAAIPGTLAAARQWSNRDLSNQMWEKVGKDLGLSGDELQKYWKDRVVRQIRRASYGTGSFIVVKKAVPNAKPGSQPTAPPPRRPPGSSPQGGNKNVPQKPAKIDKPPTEEEWWTDRPPSDRVRWLLANFAETGGWFDVVKTEELNCQGCGGTGSLTSSGANGQDESHFCVQCNGCGRVRTVHYR